VGIGVGDGSAVSVTAAVGAVLASTAPSLFTGVADGFTSTRANAGGSVDTAVGYTAFSAGLPTGVGYSTDCTGLASVAAGEGDISVVGAPSATSARG
jgi:hypothetical protein